MKRIKSIFIILTISTLLISCNSKEKDTKVEETKQEIILETENQASKTHVINLVGEDDLAAEVSTKDDWETAKLIDVYGDVHFLNRNKEEDGIYLANDKGVSIHLINGKAILILDKEYNLKFKILIKE